MTIPAHKSLFFCFLFFALKNDPEGKGLKLENQNQGFNFKKHFFKFELKIKSWFGHMQRKNKQLQCWTRSEY